MDSITRMSSRSNSIPSTLWWSGCPSSSTNYPITDELVDDFMTNLYAVKNDGITQQPQSVSNNRRRLRSLEDVAAVITERHDKDPTEKDAENPPSPPDFSDMPSMSPSAVPSLVPTSYPSISPSTGPTISAMPSMEPSSGPTDMPSIPPTGAPSLSFMPTASHMPTATPYPTESHAPSGMPSISFMPTASSMPTASFMPTESHAPSGMPSLSFMPTTSHMPTESPAPSLEVVNSPSVFSSLFRPLCVLDANGLHGNTSSSFVTVPYLYNVEHSALPTAFTQEQVIRNIEKALGNILVADLWEECPTISLNDIGGLRRRKRTRSLEEIIDQKETLVADLVGYRNAPNDFIDATSQCQDTPSDGNDCISVNGQLTLYTQSPPPNNDARILAISQTQTAIQQAMANDHPALYAAHSSIVKITYIDPNNGEEVVLTSAVQDEPVPSSKNYMWVMAPAFGSALLVILLIGIRRRRRNKANDARHYNRENITDGDLYRKYDMRSMTVKPGDEEDSDDDNDTTMDTSYTGTTYDDVYSDVEIVTFDNAVETTKFKDLCFGLDDVAGM